MRTAIYVRVSSEEQAKFGYSLEEQKRLGEDYCKEHGHTVVGVYADEGVSASKTLTKRKALLRMVSDAEMGNIDLIVFKDLTRWSRNGSAFYKVQDRLDKCGVPWISIQQPYLETMTPTGRFQVSIVLGASQLEAEQTGERVRFIQDGRVQKGYYPFGAQAIPFGYKTEKTEGGFKLVPSPAEAQVVRDVYDYFISCANLTHTADAFGLRYTHTVKILSNRIYLGEFRGLKDFCEPLITQEQFDSAQRMRKHKTYPNKKRGTYTFSSVGRCWCGSALIASTMAGTTKAYYRCTACRKKGISEKVLEETILTELERYLGDEEIDVKAKYHERAAQRKTLVTKLDRLNDLYIDGNISKAKYKEKKTALEAQISALADERKPISATFKGNWKEAYMRLDAKEKNVLWKSTLEKFVLNQDRTVTLFFA